MGDDYCVYIHTAPNGKKYVGITRQTPANRWKNGFGYSNSPHFFNAIQKYGWDNIKHEIVLSNLSREVAGEQEKILISKYRSYHPDFGYNVSLGGEFGIKHSAETRDKISRKAIERYSYPENRERMREARLGKRHTVEAKLKISAAKMGKPHPLSEETKRKISEKNKETFTKSPIAAETRERCRRLGQSKSVRVSCFSKEGELLGTFASYKEAGRYLGISDGNISLCCNGKRKSAGGYLWRQAT